MKRRNDLTSYFKPVNKKLDVDSGIQHEPSPEISSEGSTPQAQVSTNLEEPEKQYHPTPSCSKHVQGDSPQDCSIDSNNEKLTHEHDICKYAKAIPPGEELLKIYDQIWKPLDNFVFPPSKTRNLRFQNHWFKQFPWLAYSEKLDGAFCKICVLFGGIKVSQKGEQQLRGLVTEPYNKWKHALQDFRAHQTKEYHITCMLKYESRKKVGIGAILPVNIQVDYQNQKMIEENKKKIIPTIETVLLLGRQGMPLRGKRDYGEIKMEEPIKNDGNFRALLRYRAKTDAELAKHLQTDNKNAMYISNTIQNEIIKDCHTLITERIVEKVNKAQGFSILADETADIAGIEQVSIALRYFDEELNKIREDFLEFVPVTSTTGSNLADTILTCLGEHGIQMEYMIGQGYDGARAMSGEFHGVQAIINEKYPKAIYVHCASHCLNLAVTAACEVSQIRNCLGTIEQVYNFFNTPKRLNALKQNIAPKATNHTKLMKLCETRWVERHEAVATFVELQPYVITTIEDIRLWPDKQTSSSAFQLLNSITTLEFQVSCKILESVHSIVIPLSRMLQSPDIDLGEAINLAKLAFDEISRRRSIASNYFKIIFEAVTTFCNTHDIDVRMPRIVGRQTHRSNVNTSSTEEYYRISIFIPFLDTYISHLHDRFTRHENILGSFTVLMKINKAETMTAINEKIKILYNFYESILDCNSSTLVGEVTLWRALLMRENTTVKNAWSGIQMATKSSFPHVHHLFRLLAAIPVTTATNERSFSTLKRLKTYLRNTMSEHRLNGLASLNIHREIILTTEEVLKKFAEKPRRLLFTLPD